MLNEASAENLIFLCIFEAELDSQVSKNLVFNGIHFSATTKGTSNMFLMEALPYYLFNKYEQVSYLFNKY